MDDFTLVGRGWSFPPEINTNGGFALVEAYEEIDEAILIILSTAVGERVMRPTFGSQLYELVFAPLNEETVAVARRHVVNALTMWEPRITLQEVKIGIVDRSGTGYHPPGTLSIEIQYVIKSTGDQRTLVYPFYTIGEE